MLYVAGGNSKNGYLVVDSISHQQCMMTLEQMVQNNVQGISFGFRKKKPKICILKFNQQRPNVNRAYFNMILNEAGSIENLKNNIRIRREGSWWRYAGIDMAIDGNNILWQFAQRFS